MSFWAGGPHGSSGDESSYTLAASSGAPKANYQVQVKRLATGEVWAHNATAGVRDFGAANAGLNVFAAKTTKLTDLTDGTGTSLGVAVGQTISLSGLQGGTPVTSATAYTVTAASTLDDLKTWAQGQVPGSTVTIETGGRIRVKSPVGSDQELTSLALSTAGAAAGFDIAFGSSAASARRPPASARCRSTTRSTSPPAASPRTSSSPPARRWRRSRRR